MATYTLSRVTLSLQNGLAGEVRKAPTVLSLHKKCKTEIFIFIKELELKHNGKIQEGAFVRKQSYLGQFEVGTIF